MINTAVPATDYRVQADVPFATTPATQVAVKFWGVRGSVPTPTPANQRYGGNTVCVEISIGDQHIICDGGTGLVGLGYALSQQEANTQAHMLFTHTQWDRIQGFPFFQPAFTPHNRFSIYGGVAPNGASIKHCLTDQMLKPHFSMPLQHMRAQLDFHTISEQDRFQIGEVTVETLKTNPLSEALGYCLTWQDYKLVYATDTPTNCADSAFLNFVAQADILIYDGTYADLSYLKDGTASLLQGSLSNSTAHEPWELGVEIAQQAQVKKLVLLHHSPVQDDGTLDRLQSDLQDRLPGATVAYEGMQITL